MRLYLGGGLCSLRSRSGKCTANPSVSRGACSRRSADSIAIGVTIGALTLFDGYDVFNPAYVIHYVMQPWHLRPAQAGLLVSSGLVGFLLGSAAHGPVADKVGRRVTLLSGLWIASIFTLATALFANSFASFCTLRLLTGLGLGVLLPLATTYINEFAPQRSANTYAIWAVAFGWALGGSLAGVVGILVTPAYGWQSLYWIGGGLSVLLIPIVYVTLPESVRYLAMKAQVPQIVAIMARLRPENADRYREASPGRGATARNAKHHRHSAVTVVPPHDAVCLDRGILLSLLHFWALRVVADGHAAAWSGLCRQFWVRRAAPDLHLCRRPCLRLSFRPAWNTADHDRALVDTGRSFGAGAVAVAQSCGHLCLVWAAGFFFGAQFVLNNFTADAYETRIRATAVGMELSVGRVGAILGPWVAGLSSGSLSRADRHVHSNRDRGAHRRLGGRACARAWGGQSHKSPETDAAERRRSLT